MSALKQFIAQLTCADLSYSGLTRGPIPVSQNMDPRLKPEDDKLKLNNKIELGNGIEYAENFPLNRLTTFRIGGIADVLVRPSNENELLHIIQLAHQLKIPAMILGGGSNIVISDRGLRGIVIRLKGQLSSMHTSPCGKEIIVGAGETFPKLTSAALRLGWDSALGWHGTPGQVGGALRMNAGGRLGEIGDTVVEIHGVSVTGKHVFSREDAGFGYRSSNLPNNVVLTKAILQCNNANKSSANDLLKATAVLLQKRKASQPKNPSAGSMFKNPPGDFAGRLIESCGLKGFSIGDAEVSQVHANFIVNKGNAKANEVFKLAKIVKAAVFEKTRVLLEYEVRFVGSFIEE